MSVTIEQDLKEILAKIEQKLDNLQEDVTALQISNARIEGEIKALDEKLSGQIKAIEKRLESQEFISRGVLIGLLIAILGGLAKLLGFVDKP